VERIPRAEAAVSPAVSAVEGSMVRPSAFSNRSSEAIRDEPSHNQALTPQPDFAMADCRTRLAHKINAARLTNSLIWTALSFDPGSTRQNLDTVQPEAGIAGAGARNGKKRSKRAFNPAVKAVFW